MRKIAIGLMALLLSTGAYAKSEKVTLEGSKGKLAAVIQTPELKAGEKVPMVMLMHGFMGKKESPLEEQMAASLEAQGIASIRFDFNGHGESEGDFQEMTVPNEIEDAKKVLTDSLKTIYHTRIAYPELKQGETPEPRPHTTLFGTGLHRTWRK